MTFMKNGTRVVVVPKYRTDLVSQSAAGKLGTIVSSSFFGTVRQYEVRYDEPDTVCGVKIETELFLGTELIRFRDTQKETGQAVLNAVCDHLQTYGFCDLDETKRIEAQSLWTTACKILGWECDTSKYDSALFGLWNAVRDDITYNEFDAFMRAKLA